MGAGGAFDADASKIDRRGLRHFRKMVGDSDEFVGVDVTGLGRIRPGPTGRINRTVVIAVQNDNRARALASGGGKIIADAEILAVDVEPEGLRFRGALL